MRKLVLAAALATPLMIAHPGSACQYTQVPEPVGQGSAQYFAKEMVAAATYIDLVLVEDDGVRTMGEQPTGVLHLRTIARLKGNSADRFTLFGTGLTLSPDASRVFAAPLEHFTSDTGYVTPFPYSEERETRLLPIAGGAVPPPPPPMTSCSPNTLSAETGRFYVVMRGADGRLLDRVALRDRDKPLPNAPAFGFVPVTMTDKDFWLWSVRMAASPDAPTGAPALLYLRPDSDPVRAEATLRAAGAKIRAAYFARGSWIEEVRPSAEEQTRPWLAKAAPFVLTSRRGRIGDPHHSAAEFLRGKLGPDIRYGTSLGYEIAQAFTRSVRDAQGATAAPRLVAFEIAGDPQAFAANPLVERIAPLDRPSAGLLPVAGADEASVFATIQRIERDIWLLNGGNGNRQGTLP